MEIKNRYTGEVIFSGDYETMRLCIEAALSDGKNLRGSDLRGSDLRGSDLSGSDLSGVSGAVQWQAPGGCKRICISVAHGDKVMHKIGCFWGDTDEAAAAIIKEYGENSLYEKIMRLNAEALK